MRNIKEIRPILACIYCINKTNGNEDKDITDILEYAFRRILNANTNLLALSCIKRNKQDIMPEIQVILKEDTKYYDKQSRI